jgi:hypothetical protein
MELPTADIDGIDLGRPAGEQHIGEPSGRGADVESHPPLGVEAESIEGGGKLEPAAGDIRRGARLDRKSGAGRDQRARLQRRHARHAHAPSPHEVGGSGARGRQTSFHQ